MRPIFFSFFARIIYINIGYLSYKQALKGYMYKRYTELRKNIYCVHICRKVLAGNVVPTQKAFR